MDKNLIKKIFKPNIIYEGILTCFKNKKIHIASMGFTFNENFDLIIKPFKETETYKIIKEKKKAIINVVNDARLFYTATYEKEINKNEAKLSRKLKLPRLKYSNLYIECKLKKIIENETRASFIMEPIYIYSRKTYVKPYTRAEFALIEALIHSTRIKVFLNFKMYDEVDKLISLIDHYSKLIQRIAPKSEYEKIMEKINRIVEKELKFKD